MKTLLAVIIASLVTASLAQAKDDPIAVAMRAALYGPEVKKLKVYGHKFNVKPVTIQRDRTGIIVNGQISHHLRFRPDDQVYYIISKSGNRVSSVSRKIARGGWAGIVAPIASVVGSYFTGVPIPPDKIETIGHAIGRAQDGSWEGASDAIIANVALRVR